MFSYFQIHFENIIVILFRITVFLIEKFSFLTNSIALMNQTNSKMMVSCSTKRSITSLNELYKYVKVAIVMQSKHSLIKLASYGLE